MKTFFKEFKEFAVKGNMIDMAVGIIIGASFNTVIDVLVKQVLLPPIALLSDGINLSEKQLILREAVTNSSGDTVTDALTIGYGAFTEALLDFFIVGLTVFIVVKAMNRLRNRSHDTKDKTVTTPKDIQLLDSINDLLKAQNELLKHK